MIQLEGNIGEYGCLTGYRYGTDVPVNEVKYHLPADLIWLWECANISGRPFVTKFGMIVSGVLETANGGSIIFVGD